MKSLKYIVALALAAGLFQACDLERYPLTDLSEETFWNSESNAELALTSLYRGSLTDGVEYNPSDWWSYHGMIMMELFRITLLTVGERTILSLRFRVET